VSKYIVEKAAQSHFWDETFKMCSHFVTRLTIYNLDLIRNNLTLYFSYKPNKRHVWLNKSISLLTQRTIHYIHASLSLAELKSTRLKGLWRIYPSRRGTHGWCDVAIHTQQSKERKPDPLRYYLCYFKNIKK